MELQWSESKLLLLLLQEPSPNVGGCRSYVQVCDTLQLVLT
jgi:hypothetical protein